MGYSRFWLAGVVGLAAISSIVGIGWGLPSRSIDKYLFGEDEAWSGEKIYRLANAEAKLAPDSASRTGADVDVNPLKKPESGGPISLTMTDEDVARIYLRYRLYTFQPDEMITMMALAGMRPSQLQLDPRLYQYGGLFIYPVGALIKLCDLVGLIDVRSDTAYYLDHPDEFGKFYIVARAYSAAWGLIGVLLVYVIARRLTQQSAILHSPTASRDKQPTAQERWHLKSVSDVGPFEPVADGARSRRAGIIAALLFAVMPVVVCMAHEGKPHLPGAVLMLAAVYLAIRSVESRFESGDSRGAATTTSSGEPRETTRYRVWFRWMCIACGAATGMVLSSWLICVLIPLVAWIHCQNPKDSGRMLTGLFIRQTVRGIVLAVAVYGVTNPYVVINAFANQEVLRSNFGNSLAMYEIARIGESFSRVTELTVEGASLPVAVCGLFALAAAVCRRGLRFNAVSWVVVVPAAAFFLQFVAIGAGKPAEYGRFGVFPNAALAIGAACVLNARVLQSHWLLRVALPAFVVAWVAAMGGGYLRNFHMDTTDRASRIVLAETVRSLGSQAGMEGKTPTVTLFAEPAPYNCPPLDFSEIEVILAPSPPKDGEMEQQDSLTLRPIDGGLPLTSDLWDLVVRASGIRKEPVRATPISWANKPFDVRLPGEH